MSSNDRIAVVILTYFAVGSALWLLMPPMPNLGRKMHTRLAVLGVISIQVCAGACAAIVAIVLPR